jgi:hypothetical protein
MNDLLSFLILGWGLVALFFSFHASSNNKTSAWGVVIFFLGIFGMVGYAISLASDN